MASSGRTSASRSCTSRYQGGVFGVALRMLDARNLAEDAVQVAADRRCRESSARAATEARHFSEAVADTRTGRAPRRERRDSRFRTSAGALSGSRGRDRRAARPRRYHAGPPSSSRRLGHGAHHVERFPTAGVCASAKPSPRDARRLNRPSGSTPTRYGRHRVSNPIRGPRGFARRFESRTPPCADSGSGFPRGQKCSGDAFVLAPRCSCAG